MRKVLSFVLVLSLVLGSLGMAFAAPLSDVGGEDFEDAVNVLTELGVIDGFPDGTYRPGEIVTRGQMAKIVIAALGLEDYAAGTSGFKDMAGHWSDKFVAYAVGLGIINGYPDGTFRPDNTVSYDEAAKMLVAALGYTEEALVGSWPTNWVTKAKVLGILDGVTAGSAGANRGDIATMAFQTLGLQMGKVDKNGRFVTTQEETNGQTSDTMLSRLGAAVYADKDGDIAFVLDEDWADNAIANVRAYLGAYVTAYVNNAKDQKIIAVKEVKSVFLDGELKAGGEFKADGVEYDFTAPATTGGALGFGFDGGNEDAVSFENGKTVAKHTGVGDYKIAAKVSGKKITEVYSVAKWTATSFGMFKVSDLDLEENTLMNTSFEEDDNDEIDFNYFALLGVSKLEDIAKDNVVYVYGDPIARIEVGTEVVEGTITKIASNGKITVDGKVYEKAKYVKADFDYDSVKDWLKEEVTLYLDYNGDVFFAETESSEGGNYAVILQTEASVSSLAAGNENMVKLFLADGTVKVFDVDEDVTLPNGFDGVAGGLFDTLAGEVVEYGVDKDGVIDFFELVAGVTATLAEAETVKVELTAKLTYDGVPVIEDAVLFGYKDSGKADTLYDKDNYYVTTVAKVKGTEFIAVNYTDKNKIKLMMIKGDAEAPEGVYGVITGWAQDAASSTGRQLMMLVDGVAETYDVTKTFYNNELVTGSALNLKDVLYEVSFNSLGVVTGLGDNFADDTILWANITKDDAPVVKVISNTAANYEFANKAVAHKTTVADKYTVDNDVVVYLYKDGASAFVKSSLSTSNLKNAKVYLYDMDGDKVVDVVLIIKL